MSDEILIINNDIYKKIACQDSLTHAVKIFAHSDAEQQARFFHELYEIVDKWTDGGGLQWLAMKDNMSPEAKLVFRDMSDHILGEEE